MSKSSYFPRFFAKRSIPDSSGQIGHFKGFQVSKNGLLGEGFSRAKLSKGPRVFASVPHKMGLLGSRFPEDKINIFGNMNIVILQG